MTANNKQASKLENNISYIEKLIDQLETDELTLTDSLKAFEKGIKLIRDCQSELNNAEQKIKTLTKTNLTNNN